MAKDVERIEHLEAENDALRKAIAAVQALIDSPESCVMECQECAVGPSLVAALALAQTDERKAETE